MQLLNISKGLLMGCKTVINQSLKFNWYIFISHTYCELTEFLFVHGPGGLSNMESVSLQGQLPMMVTMDILKEKDHWHAYIIGFKIIIDRLQIWIFSKGDLLMRQYKIFMYSYRQVTNLIPTLIDIFTCFEEVWM